MRVRRARLVDLYAEDDRCVVMVDENVLVLGEVATVIVEGVPEGADVDVADVAASVIDVFGQPEPPHTAEELTLQHVHDLVAHGVLEIGGSRDTTSPFLDHRRGAVDTLRSALRHVRSGGAEPWQLPEAVSSDDFVAAAHQHHVVAFLSRHLDRLAMPARARSLLEADAAGLRAGAHVVAEDLARALDALDRAGVRAISFKGVALAVQAHGDLTARGAGDIDLLVAPEDLEAAHATLSEAGWAPDAGFPTPGPSWAWRHLVRTNYELTLVGTRTAIDLHWYLAPTRGTFPRFDVLWARRAVVEVAGRAVPTLSPYDALVHAASHAAKDGWPWLRSLLDIHLLASRADTWRGADRQLRSDQLLSVGLAGRCFGVPDRAPEVVDHAVARSGRVWPHVRARHVDAETRHVPRAMPGHTFVVNLRTTARTRGTPKEAVRLLSRSALPPWLTSQETSPHAFVAVPRVLARRVRELSHKLRASRIS